MKKEDIVIEKRLEKFKSVAKKAGIKLTHQRLEIFREIAASVDHPSAEAILKAVLPRMPTVSLDTVYRTLWLLADLGLVTTLGPRRGGVRFDANIERHHHYVCVQCGMIRDFNSEELNEIRVPDTVKKFGKVFATHVEVRGICDRCEKKEPLEPKEKKVSKSQTKKRRKK